MWLCICHHVDARSMPMGRCNMLSMQRRVQLSVHCHTSLLSLVRGVLVIGTMHSSQRLQVYMPMACACVCPCTTRSCSHLPLVGCSTAAISAAQADVSGHGKLSHRVVSLLQQAEHAWSTWHAQDIAFVCGSGILGMLLSLCRAPKVCNAQNSAMICLSLPVRGRHLLQLCDFDAISCPSFTNNACVCLMTCSVSATHHRQLGQGLSRVQQRIRE
jgi:hypothetical protein